jgi:hypothetical protein
LVKKKLSTKAFARVIIVCKHVDEIDLRSKEKSISLT